MDATAVSVGAVIGAGIFVVTGIAAGLAGSALMISMLIAAVISLFSALSFAELTAWQPREGSVYEYTYQLISPFFGFLIGWMWVVSNTFAGAAVSLGFAKYLTALFPILSPNCIATILCIVFAAVNFFGIRQSALLNNILVAAKLLILAFFVIYGLPHINTANFASFDLFQPGVLYGAFYFFFAYGGFARVAVIAEEVKDARRNVPRAILLSLAISTMVYILVGFVAIGLIGANQLAWSDSPLTKAINATKSEVAPYIVSIGGLLASASVLLSATLGVSRMAYAMARRKDLPNAFSKLHEKYKTPYYSIWIIGVLMVVLVLFLDLTRVVAIGTFALLFYYTLANICGLRIKAQKRVYPRIVSVLGATTCLILLLFSLFISSQTWMIGGTCLIIGIIYYLAKQKFSPKM